MDKTIANKINSVLRLPHEELAELTDKEPIAWSGEVNNRLYQAEIVCIWDDKSRRTVRINCFVNYSDRPWWKRFSDETVYDSILAPEDKRELLVQEEGK